MIGMRFKRDVIARDKDGNRYALKEHVKLIDTSTMHTKGQREIVEGSKKWYLGEGGLVAGTDPFAKDGSLEVKGSDLRLWLETEA